MCIYLNNKLSCFKNDRQCIETEHARAIFGNDNCNSYSDYIYCSYSGLYCSVYYSGDSKGNIECVGSGGRCAIYVDGSVYCSQT